MINNDEGGNWKQWQILFSQAPVSLWTWTVAMKKKKKSCPWKKSCDKPRKSIKKQRPYFVDKGPYSQAVVFPIVIYGCENWMINKAENQRTDALNYGDGEDSWESLRLQGDQDT